MGYYFSAVETTCSKVMNTSLIPIVSGQFLICTDSGDVFYDTDKGVRKHMTDIIDLDNDAERTAILAPLNKIYFVKETRKLWRFLNSEWVDLIPDKSDGSKTVYATLTSGAWEDKQQKVSIDGLTAEQNGVAGLPLDITGMQMEAARDAELYLCGQSDGEIVIAAYGVVPQVDIPIIVILCD